MNESSEEGKKNKVGVFCHCKKTRDNRFIKEKVYFGSWFWRFHYMIFLPNGFESVSETLYTVRTAGRAKCSPYYQEDEEREKNMQYVLLFKHSSSSK